MRARGLVRDNDLIAVEDLAVRAMTRNRRLARAIADAGWGRFRAMLEYKCARWGRTLVVVDRWYPSSKTCGSCGHVLSALPLAAGHWTCPACRARHDRDLNAARNILAAGRVAAVRASPGDACGADVRHGQFCPVRSAMKQEAPPPRSAAAAPRG